MQITNAKFMSDDLQEWSDAVHDEWYRNWKATAVHTNWRGMDLEIGLDTKECYGDFYDNFDEELKRLLDEASSKGPMADSLRYLYSTCLEEPPEDFEALAASDDLATTASWLVEAHFVMLTQRAIEADPEVLRSIGLDPADYGH